MMLGALSNHPALRVNWVFTSFWLQRERNTLLMHFRRRLELSIKTESKIKLLITYLPMCGGYSQQRLCVMNMCSLSLPS